MNVRAIACVLWLAACGDDATPPPTTQDAGADAGPPPAMEVLRPAAPTPAMEPSPPVLGACPDGWLTGADGESCAPYPQDARPSACDEITFQPPGEAACVPVGRACPAGDWPEEIPVGSAVVYVRAGSPAGGTGSRESPLATINAGIALVSADGVVVVAKGRYTEGIRVPAGVTIVGACSAETLIDPPSLRMVAVDIDGPDVVLRDLSMHSPGEGIYVSGASASVTVEGVIVGPTRTLGVRLLEGARATLRSVAIREAVGGLLVDMASSVTVERSVIERSYDTAVTIGAAGTTVVLDHVRIGESRSIAGGVINSAVSAQTESTIDIRASVIAASSHTAVRAKTGATVSLFDSLVTGVVGAASGEGDGLEALEGGLIHAERIRVEAPAGAAVVVNGAGSDMSVLDSVLRGSASDVPPDTDNIGVYVRTDGRLVLERSRVEGFRIGGVGVLRGGLLVATDVLIRDMVGTRDGIHGTGVEIGAGGHAELHRVRIDHARELAILLTGEGTSLVAEDLVVSGTLETASDLHSGRALVVQDGAGADVVRARFEDNLDVAFEVRDMGSVATVSDLVIERVGEDIGEGRFGRGLELIAGAQLRLTRARISEATEVALLIEGEGTVLDAEDVVVMGTRSGSVDGRFGRGVEVITSGRLTLSRALIVGNRDVALLASGAGTTVELIDVEVRGTESATSERPTGVGVGAIGEATVAMRRFIVEGHAALGVQVADGASLDLRGGLVSACPIGANVAIDGYDVRRVLAPDVVFRDNGRDLSLDSIGAPEPLARRD